MPCSVLSVAPVLRSHRSWVPSWWSQVRVDVASDAGGDAKVHGHVRVCPWSLWDCVASSSLFVLRAHAQLSASAHVPAAVEAPGS